MEAPALKRPKTGVRVESAAIFGEGSGEARVVRAERTRRAVRIVEECE
jgi:hypothetical protein